MKEYALSKQNARFIYVTTPPLLVLFIGVWCLPFLKSDTSWLLFFLLTPVLLPVMAYLIIRMLDAKKGKFVIDGDKVYTTSVLGTRQLSINEIKGYWRVKNHLLLEPLSPQKKRIKISTRLERSKEIVEWAASRYPNMVSVALEEEQNSILNDETLGNTLDERKQKWERAKTFAKVFNGISIAVALWALVWPTPYEFALWCSFLLVLGAIAATKCNKLLRIAGGRSSAYPSVIWAFFAPCSALGIRGLFDYNLYSYAPVWIPVLGFTVFLLAILLIKSKDLTFKKPTDFWIALALCIFMLEYSYGAWVFFNCRYDISAPEIFSAQVLDKHVSKGKTTRHSLLLSPWATRTVPENVTVSKPLYDLLAEQDSVTLVLHKGKFGIPWYEVQ